MPPEVSARSKLAPATGGSPRDALAKTIEGALDHLEGLFRWLPDSFPAGGDYRLALGTVHKVRGLQQARFILRRHGQETVAVGVDELAGLNPAAEDFDRYPFLSTSRTF